MESPARPFLFPQNLSVEKQIIFSLEVINKYRSELRPLRNKIILCQKYHDPLIAEVQIWKEKYHKEKQEKNKARREVEKLQKEKDKLKQEIEKLTKTNNRYQVGLFDHGNFHHPCQKDKKPNGGQLGHKDTNQDKNRNKEPFVRQHLFATRCGNCGNPLSRVKAIKEKTLIDIQINTQLIKVILQSERQWCKNCHKEVNARSSQTLPFTEYGINTFMMILPLRFKSHQSVQKISTVLSLGFGLSIAPSAILSLLSQAKIYLKKKYDKLKQAIRNGEVMYNDETGWLVHGQKAWMWIMTTNDKKDAEGNVWEAGITVYVAAESRGKGIMEEMYGNSNAFSMHDGYSGYVSVTGKDKTVYCWSHVLRFAFEETITEKNPTALAIQIRDRLVTLYQTIRARSEWTSKQKEATLRIELDSLVKLTLTDEASRNILHRIATQKEGLILALLVTPDGTNNLAERELRPMAIHRNLSYGSATFKGMETTAILGSIVQTISRNKEQTFLSTLKSYLFTGIEEKYPQYKHPPSFVT